MFENLDTGMTRDRYFEMQEQMGHEPDEDMIPPDMDDLPELCHKALDIYNRMGDRVYPEIGYIGKDYTNLDFILKHFFITERAQIEWTYELILFLERRAIEDSRKQMKSEYDKIKKK